MIRVIHYVWSLDFGGIERLTLDAASEQLKNKDLRTSILVGKAGGKMFSMLKDSGIPYTVAGLRGGGDFSMAGITRLKKIFQDADVIHFHTFTPPVALAAILSGKRIVYTEHGNFAFGRKSTAADNVNRLLLKLFLNRYVSFVTFNSEFTRKEACSRYGLKQVRAQVIYNGMSIRPEISIAPAPDSVEASKGKFVVGTSSRFAGFKRIDRLIRAFGLFAVGKKDVRLMLVGDGPLKKELEQLVERNNLSEQTVFTGYSDSPGVFQQAMDVCVFPSEKEPFGIAALETLSLGKPTLVMSDGGGILEIVSGVEPADIVDGENELAQRLEHYYSARQQEDPAVKKRMTVAGTFNIARMEKEFYSVYKELVT